MTKTIEINVVCATCDRPDPQATRGCDRPDCGWRAEAMLDMVARGGTLHSICDETNNSAKSLAGGYLNIRIEAWPEIKGTA